MEITLENGKVVVAHFNEHVIRTDQPLDNGGGNTAPAPFDLYLASIGTCAGVYVKSFCDRRNIPVNGIRIIQSVDFDMEKRVPSTIKIDIQLPADFPEKYRDAVKNSADLCAVKRSIHNPPKFEITTSTVSAVEA